MPTATILWIDDETESLRSQVKFLEQKGYAVTLLSNGYDALDHLKQHVVDVVLLDETMPGITGLETLSRIKAEYQALPVVMVTKNETENLMEEAIGSQISDYLIKPVNPNQVLLSLKKILDNKRLVSERTTTNYQQEFRNLFMALNSNPDAGEWIELYRKLVYWEMEMEKADSPEMREVLQTQKEEANTEFFKFVQKQYLGWIKAGPQAAPLMSHNLIQRKVLPALEPGIPVFLVLIDNLRYDQWRAIQPLLSDYFRVVSEEGVYSILPTATHYARNAIFSGLMPADIQQKYPDKWKQDDEEGSKNMHEEAFLLEQLKRLGKQQLKVSYTKVLNHEAGQKLVGNIHNLLQNDLNVIVYNFIDMLSHARTEMEVLKELASDERSYRSIAQSWFTHSPLFEALKRISDKPMRMVLATDHGSIRVKKPAKVIGDRQTTANIRYKHGRNLNYDERDVLVFKNPKEAGLPSPNISSAYIFAKEDGYLCYPNNYNHFANYYRNSFQHGGVSLEEMIVPVVVLENR